MKHLSVIIHSVTEAEEAEWSLYVPWVQRIINNTESRATGYAPVTIVFGQEHVAESKLMEFTAREEREEIKDYDSFVTKHNAVLALVQDASNKYLDEALLEKFRKLEDEQEQCSELLKEGDYVLLRNPRKTKLSLKWLGPYRVVKATADNFYVLHDVTQDLESVQHREDLYVITDCTNDEEAREYARMDTNELTIEEVLSHEGDVQRPTTVLFTCKCIEMDEPIKFSFKSCKYVAKVQDYIKANEKHCIHKGRRTKHHMASWLHGSWRGGARNQGNQGKPRESALLMKICSNKIFLDNINKIGKFKTEVTSFFK